MKKRVLSLMLALVLALSLTPAALAYDGQTSRIDKVSESEAQAPALMESSPAVTGWEERAPFQEQTPAPGEQHLYGASIDEEQVYQTLNSCRSVYPEGMYWTNESQKYTLSVPVYDEKDGRSYYMTGYGCVAFCYRLSDAAFGDLSARKVYSFTYDDVRVGDILRVNNDTHSVIVIQKFSDYVVLAEGNYNSSVHWDRTMTRAEVMRSNYITTRYSSGASSDAPSDTPSDIPSDVLPNAPSNLKLTADRSIFVVDEPFYITVTANDMTGFNVELWRGGYGTGTRIDSVKGFSPNERIKVTLSSTNSYTVYVEAYNDYGTTTATMSVSAVDSASSERFMDVPPGAYYAGAVDWAVNNGITEGTGGNRFSPDSTVTRGQAVTFLWRAMGQPSPSSLYNPFTDVSASSYYYQAVLWAVENGITDGVGNMQFNPNGSVTRGQMITFLWRTQGRPGATGQGAWYADAEYWARANALLSGTAVSYTTNGTCPRSDVVYYLWNALA